MVDMSNSGDVPDVYGLWVQSHAVGVKEQVVKKIDTKKVLKRMS